MITAAAIATAVLVNATIARMVLVPRVLQRRLPHLEVEHEVQQELASSSS
jgi:hypothetical protein